MTIDLDKLEQLHAKTTPGLWSLDPVEYAANDCCWAEGHWDVDGENGGWVVHAGEQPDAEWIAEIHNAAPALIAELREARKAVETQRKVADAYLEALQDEYRPHVEQNKAFGLVIAAQTEEIEQLKAAIERVRALADDLDRRGCLSCSSLTGGDDLAVELREALDGARD